MIHPFHTTTSLLETQDFVTYFGDHNAVEKNQKFPCRRLKAIPYGDDNQTFDISYRSGNILCACTCCQLAIKLTPYNFNCTNLIRPNMDKILREYEPVVAKPFEVPEAIVHGFRLEDKPVKVGFSLKDRPDRERTCCWLAGQAIEDDRFPFSELVQENGDLTFKVIPYESSFATCSDCHIGYGIEPIALASPEFSRELEHLGQVDVDGCGVLINLRKGYLTIGHCD